MEIEQILKKYRYIVDKQLNIFFNKKIDETQDQFLKTSYNYNKEFVLRPGKRIRPIATIMAYKSIKDSNEKKIYPVSIVPELFHTSSLIHDDIMDEDLLRRNKPTMHKIFELYFKRNFIDKNYKGDLFGSLSKRYSISMAIIQGNILYSLANSCIINSKLRDDIKNKSLKILNLAYRSTNEGQIYDVVMPSKDVSDEEEYIKMTMGKTASPLAASMIFGAILNNANHFQLKNIKKYGLCVGLAYQIHDDSMDINKAMSKGRKLGSDIRRGNKTLMIIKALQNSNEKQKKFLLKVLGNNKATKAEIEKSIDIIKNTSSLDYATVFAKKKIIEAKKHLKKANLNNLGNKFFSDFADYVVKRRV